MIDTTPSLALLILIAVLVGTGVTLMLERSLSRIAIGSCLVTYGVNVMLLMAGGRAGGPPILGQTPVEQMSDPLPQAMVLTAIVIGLALTAFMLAMSYRSWQLNGNDEVADDREDRRIKIMAARDTIDDRTTDDTGSETEDVAADQRDETSDDPEGLPADLETFQETDAAPDSVEDAQVDFDEEPRPGDEHAEAEEARTEAPPLTSRLFQDGGER